MSNENFSERNAILFQLAPASRAAAAYAIGPAAISGFNRLTFLVQLATPAGGATVDFQAAVALTSGGSYTNVTGATVTQITSGTNPIFLVEIKAETIARTLPGALYLKGTLTVGTAAELSSAALWGSSAAYSPASDSTITNVVQTVVV